MSLPQLQPSISGLEDFHSVQIFNEDYVNQYVYQPDELIKDSFTIFVKTPDYDRNMAEITQLLESISQTFQSHPELDQSLAALVSDSGHSRLPLAAFYDGDFEVRTRNRNHLLVSI